MSFPDALKQNGFVCNSYYNERGQEQFYFTRKINGGILCLLDIFGNWSSYSAVFLRENTIYELKPIREDRLLETLESEASLASFVDRLTKSSHT